MARLNARKVLTETAPGMHGDGAGLYLRVGASGSKSWILRTVVHGRRRDLGIGSASMVSLAEARDAAHKLRKAARAGIDPEVLRRQRAITFEASARRVHQNLQPTWRSERHSENWLSALERYVFPRLGGREIDTIGVADVLAVLEPIWTSKNDTANRIKQRIGAIFDWAKGAGHYPHENPINGLKRALPNVRPARTHRAALPWPDVPEFMSQLRERQGVSARALEFAILTAGRSGEVRGAQWGEITGNVWTVPAARMKTRKPHRVPLSDAALRAIAPLRGLDKDLVFPSPTGDGHGRGRPLSDTVFKALMDRMGRTGLTTHGFRSTFRDWCSEKIHADREVAEAALSHELGSKVERAYARSDLFERREMLMEQWASFAGGQQANNVRSISGRH